MSSILDTHDGFATSEKIYLGIFFAEYALPMVVSFALCILTVLRRRRVSSLLKTPFTLLLVSQLFFFLLLLLATIILAALLRFAVSPSSVDDIPGPLLDALATVAIVFRFFDHLSGALLVLTFLALARNLHKAGTGIYPAKRATLPLRILATLLLPAAVAEFIGEQYNFWHPFSSGSGLGLPAWYVKDLDAAISYSLLACAIGVAVLAVWSAKRVRSGLMFTAPEAPALRGTSKRLVVAAVLHLLPWVWQAVMVSIDLSFVGTMGTGSDMIGNVLRYWVRLGVMALLYTVGKWDIREGVKDGQGGAPAMGTGWRPADNHVSVQV